MAPATSFRAGVGEGATCNLLWGIKHIFRVDLSNTPVAMASKLKIPPLWRRGYNNEAVNMHVQCYDARIALAKPPFAVQDCFALRIVPPQSTVSFGLISSLRDINDNRVLSK